MHSQPAERMSNSDSSDSPAPATASRPRRFAAGAGAAAALAALVGAGIGLFPRGAPLLASAAASEVLSTGMPAVAPSLRADSGYAITSDAVMRNCGACHRRDDAGRMGRISFMRKTPEGWQASIRRMVALHGVRVEPEAAREIVRYLATQQGLAPEELRPGAFEVERRMDPFTYADRGTERTCTACHSMGRVITERRTAEEWNLLIATHRALYPLVDRQAFFDTGAPSGANGDRRHPVERAVANLSEAFPLETPEWQAWSANVRPARLEGVWALSGHEPGRGAVYGTVEIRPVAGRDDEFTTTARYRYAEDGATAERSGRGIVYTGYQWRGSSAEAGQTLREVMAVERGWGAMEGRWFAGDHDEFGIDVTLRRVTGEPVVSGVSPAALRSGGGVQEVRLHGANLPASLAPAAIDLGPGVAVREVVGATPEMAMLRVEVAADARVGRRDVFVAGVTLTDALTIYDRVHALRVTPDNGLARVGGIVVPKQYQQFQAIGIHPGPDGRVGTDDDIELGPLSVEWSLEEYPVTYDDDDIHFVGEIDARGLFTPNVDGPNPERSGNRNNIGEVWAVATYRDPRDASARPIQSRAYLIVTAPLHMRWDEWQTQ